MIPLVTDNKIVLIRYIGGRTEIQTFDDCYTLADKLIFDGDISDGVEGSQMHLLAIKSLENRLARYKKVNNIP